MGRQFLACEFKPGGRQYTYHNDGPPVAEGDRVRVEVRGGSVQSVRVVEIWAAPPSYETKPILGLADLASAAPQDPQEN